MAGSTYGIERKALIVPPRNKIPTVRGKKEHRHAELFCRQKRIIVFGIVVRVLTLCTFFVHVLVCPYVIGPIFTTDKT